MVHETFLRYATVYVLKFLEVSQNLNPRRSIIFLDDETAELQYLYAPFESDRGIYRVAHVFGNRSFGIYNTIYNAN